MVASYGSPAVQDRRRPSLRSNYQVAASPSPRRPSLTALPALVIPTAREAAASRYLLPRSADRLRNPFSRVRHLKLPPSPRSARAPAPLPRTLPPALSHGPAPGAGHDPAPPAMKDDQLRSQPPPEVSALRDRCRKLEKALRETQDLLRARDKEVDRLRRELDWLEKEKENQAQKQRSQLKRQQSMDAASWNQRFMKDDPFSDRERDGAPLALIPAPVPAAAEAKARSLGLETFLTKTDSWSGAEIVQAVQDLNSEILQFAAAAAEICASDVGRRARPPASKVAQAIQDTASRLGAPFVRVLATRDHGHDPILVQFAIQACVSTAIARFWAAFCPGLSAKYDALLGQLYMHMHVSEPQPTSSRWRSLTHQHIRTLFAGLEEHAVTELVETILRWSADIFAISGYTAPAHVSPSASGAAFAAALRARFGTQLRRVAQTVCKLVQVTREDIMSTNFEVGTVEHGLAFDAEGMTDAFADSAYALARGGGKAFPRGEGQVLCTTEIGLLCSTKKPAIGNGTPTSPDGAAIGALPVMQRMVLLKPKVVLESVTRAIDH